MARTKFKATISTDKIVWQTFVIWAKEQNSSASEILTEFMQQSVSSGEYIKKLYEQKENLESLFRKLIKEELEERDNFWIDFLEKKGILVPSNFNDSLSRTDDTDDTENRELTDSGNQEKPRASRNFLLEEKPRASRNFGIEQKSGVSTNIKIETKAGVSRNIGDRKPSLASGDKPLLQDKEDSFSENILSSNQASNETTYSPSDTDSTDDTDIEEGSPPIKSTDETVYTAGTADTDDTDKKVATDSTDDTDIASKLNNIRAKELLSDGKLKERLNLKQSRSTITRWRTGEYSQPQFIQKHFQVEGKRWKLKT